MFLLYFWWKKKQRIHLSKTLLFQLSVFDWCTFSDFLCRVGVCWSVFQCLTSESAPPDTWQARWCDARPRTWLYSHRRSWPGNTACWGWSPSPAPAAHERFQCSRSDCEQQKHHTLRPTHYEKANEQLRERSTEENERNRQRGKARDKYRAFLMNQKQPERLGLKVKPPSSGV